MSSRTLFLAMGLATLLFSGCAFDLLRVKQHPVTLRTSEMPPSSWRLQESVRVSPSGGYRRELRAGTTWIYSGSIEQGDVYRTRDQLVTVEGSNVFEAYIVVKDDSLRGFYLPVEGTFSPISRPKALEILWSDPEIGSNRHQGAPTSAEAQTTLD